MTPTDDASGYFQEGFMDDGQTLETDAQTLEVVQPCKRSLDDPARLAQTAAMRLATAGDLGSNAGGMQGLAVLVMVVSR